MFEAIIERLECAQIRAILGNKQTSEVSFVIAFVIVAQQESVGVATSGERTTAMGNTTKDLYRACCSP